MIKGMFLLIVCCLLSMFSQAQHDHHAQQKDTLANSMEGMNKNMDHQMGGMSHAFSLNLPML